MSKRHGEQGGRVPIDGIGLERLYYWPLKLPGYTGRHCRMCPDTVEILSSKLNNIHGLQSL